MAILYMTHVFSLLPRIWLMSWKGMCRRPGMVLFLCEDRIKAIRVIGINQNLKKKKVTELGNLGIISLQIFDHGWRFSVELGWWEVTELGPTRSWFHSFWSNLSLLQFVSIFHGCLSYFREDPILPLPSPQIFHKDSSSAFIFFLILEETRSF